MIALDPTFTWFAAFAAGCFLAEAAFLVFRLVRQDMLDGSLTTYELTFPRELDHDRAARLFQALSGLYARPARLAEPWGRQTVVLEVLGLPDGLHHLLSFPREMEASVFGHLRAVVPSIGITEVTTAARKWKYAVALSRQSETPADPKLAAVLLSSMRELEKGEAVMVQFVLTPAGEEWWSVGRLAASGHEIRARQLIARTLIAYRSLGVFGFRQLRQVWPVPNRSAPVGNKWDLALTHHDLAVVAGIPIDGPEIPGLVYGAGRRLVAAASIPTEGLLIGTSTYPSNPRPVALAEESARQHAWFMGGTGSGKSALLHNLAAQAMERGHGLVLIEPDGQLARDVLSTVPRERAADVVWFDPTDSQRVIGLNALGGPDPERTAGYVTGLFKSLYGDSWGPRLEQILKYGVLTASEAGLTLYDVKQLLVNKDFRTRTLKSVTDPEVRHFWRGFEEGPDNAKDSVLNKLDAFVGTRAIRNILGQTGGLDMGDVVENGRILLAPLPQAHLGEANASMLGSLLVAQFWQQVRLRRQKPLTFLMLDEFQKFLDLSVAMEDILEQARKHNVSMIVANQQTGQLPSSVLSSLRQNARTKGVFALGSEDARRMTHDFRPLGEDELQGLDLYEMAVSMMTPSGQAPTATVKTYAPPRQTGAGWLARDMSRHHYGRDRADIEAEFAARHRPDAEPPRAKIGGRQS